MWISEQTATFALYSTDRLVFITVVESVYCAVRTDCLYKGDYVSTSKGSVHQYNSTAQFQGHTETDVEGKTRTEHIFKQAGLYAVYSGDINNKRDGQTQSLRDEKKC